MTYMRPIPINNKIKLSECNNYNYLWFQYSVNIGKQNNTRLKGNMTQNRRQKFLRKAMMIYIGKHIVYYRTIDPLDVSVCFLIIQNQVYYISSLMNAK